ncbi:hypothetical protein EVAR_95781_1 [Eumeta japonica]|uniref:Uncharacterized protein n=1 Tax=Eumeta variegata TaxID=151549 RepID=A0A4C1UKP6_EUMVA|nr:hypothetical protein EVAR_95781_1 [Eumeta japonica]
MQGIKILTVASVGHLPNNAEASKFSLAFHTLSESLCIDLSVCASTLVQVVLGLILSEDSEEDSEVNTRRCAASEEAVRREEGRAQLCLQAGRRARADVAVARMRILKFCVTKLYSLRILSSNCKVARSQESEEQTQTRQMLDSQRHATQKASETYTRTQARRTLDAERHASQRASETFTQTQARQALDAERHASQRAAETVEQTQTRRV